MATNTVEKVKVKQLTKFGFQLESGEYVGWSPRLKADEKGKIVPGGEYEVDLYVAESGKKYLNAVKGVTVPAVVTPVTNKKVTKTVTNRTNNEMTREDWDKKDRRISRQGLIQVSIQVTGGDFETAVELADKMLNYVNEVK